MAKKDEKMVEEIQPVEAVNVKPKEEPLSEVK